MFLCVQGTFIYDDIPFLTVHGPIFFLNKKIITALAVTLVPMMFQLGPMNTDIGNKNSRQAGLSRHYFFQQTSFQNIFCLPMSDRICFFLSNLVTEIVFQRKHSPPPPRPAPPRPPHKLNGRPLSNVGGCWRKATKERTTDWNVITNPNINLTWSCLIKFLI